MAALVIPNTDIKSILASLVQLYAKSTKIKPRKSKMAHMKNLYLFVLICSDENLQSMNENKVT